MSNLTLRRQLRRKLRMRWFFNISKMKESSFSKSDLTDPPQNFDAHLLENMDLSPSRFHFSVGFILRSCFESDGFIAYSNEWDWREKTMFIHTNQHLFTSFYIKKYLFFPELAMSQRWSAIFLCHFFVLVLNLIFTPFIDTKIKNRLKARKNLQT